MEGPQQLVQHLNDHQYHPRSDAHSNALCRGKLQDLLDHCKPLAERAQSGEIVARLNHTVTVSFQRWNIDLAIGPPTGAALPPEPGSRIRFEVPTAIEIAIEAKGVMTEHVKARHNRLRDLQAFHNHAHAYDQNVVAVGIIVVNIAENYWSPTRATDDITRHQDIEQIAAATIELYRNIPLRYGPVDGPGLEAAGVIVVSHDNLRKNPKLPPRAPAPRPTQVISRRPAPQDGDPLNYSTMIYRTCRSYRDRWV